MQTSHPNLSYHMEVRGTVFPLGSMKTARRSYRKDQLWNQLRNFFAKRGNPFPIHRYRESVRADTNTFLARLPFCRNGPWGLLLTREAAFFPFLPCFSFRLSSLFLPFFLALFIFFLLSVFPLFLSLSRPKGLVGHGFGHHQWLRSRQSWPW